jgi:ATP-dependent Clp protease adapter protein ClpS
MMTNLPNIDLQSQVVEAPVAPGFEAEPIEESRFAPRWYVLIHNDDVTPFEYVIKYVAAIVPTLRGDRRAHRQHSAQ